MFQPLLVASRLNLVRCRGHRPHLLLPALTSINGTSHDVIGLFCEGEVACVRVHDMWRTTICRGATPCCSSTPLLCTVIIKLLSRCFFFLHYLILRSSPFSQVPPQAGAGSVDLEPPTHTKARYGRRLDRKSCISSLKCSFAIYIYSLPLLPSLCPHFLAPQNC